MRYAARDRTLQELALSRSPDVLIATPGLDLIDSASSAACDLSLSSS
jgi:hypothetical protein